MQESTKERGGTDAKKSWQLYLLRTQCLEVLISWFSKSFDWVLALLHLYRKSTETLEWIRVRFLSNFCLLPMKYVVTFSFFTWQHSRCDWEEEFSLLSGGKIMCLWANNSIIIFCKRKFGKWGRHAGWIYNWDSWLQHLNVWEGERHLFQPGFSTCMQIQEWIPG